MREDKIVFTPAEFIKEMDKENKPAILAWDDAGYWLHKPDTIEKIIEDATKLFDKFKEAMEAPDLMWTSSYSSLRKLHINNMFLSGLVQIISRIGALTKEK